jgi:hypothetical protein
MRSCESGGMSGALFPEHPNVPSATTAANARVTFPAR